MKFKDKLKQLRTEKGLTRKQLGELSGVSFRSIEGYEQGTRKPQSANLLKLSKALDIDIREFFKDITDYDLGDLLLEALKSEITNLKNIVEDPSVYPPEFFTNLHSFLFTLDFKIKHLKESGFKENNFSDLKNSRELSKLFNILIDSLTSVLIPVEMTINEKKFSKQESANLYTNRAYNAFNEIIKILNPDYFKDENTEN